MITILRAKERGRTKIKWLDSRHSFSRKNYNRFSDSPRFTNFASIQVINEDIIAAGEGFDSHLHENIEIINYVLSGTLKCEDSLGNVSNITAGDVGYISTGTGITHSEYNASLSEPVHFLQIWIVPKEKNTLPRYEQKTFKNKFKHNKLSLVASVDGREESIAINQDMNMYIATLNSREKVIHRTSPSHFIWIQVVHGEVFVDKERLEAGDSAAITNVSKITLSKGYDAEVLLFDMAVKTV